MKSLLAAIVVIGLIASTCSGPDSKDSGDAPPSTATAKTETSKECAPDDQKCVGSKNIITAHVYCKEKIERLTNRAVKWTDEGIFQQKFSRFAWVDQPGGVMRYFGDKVQFQNEYGAWTNMIYFCDVQPGEKAALGAGLVGEGRLPAPQ